MSDIAEVRAALELFAKEADRYYHDFAAVSHITCGMLQSARQALAALDRIEAGGVEGWHPMATAPKGGTHVLLWWPHWYHVPVIGFYDQIYGWQSEYAVTDDRVAPLNWQPLPPPPASQPEKEGKS